MSTKVGFNTECFSEKNPSPWRNDSACGLWLPDKGEPNAITLGRFAGVGGNWLRYGTGGEIRHIEFADMVMNGFTVLDFMRCATILGANPILQCSVYQPADIIVNVLKYIRNAGYTQDIYLEVGNEPWRNNEPRPPNPTPEEMYPVPATWYVDQYNAIYEAITDKTGIKYGASFIDSNEWDPPNRAEWDGIVWESLKDIIDWASIHQYSARPSHFTEVLDRIIKRVSVPLIVTEWNSEDYQSKRDSMEMYVYTLSVLNIFEGIPEVIGHTIWDSSCGKSWRLFEEDFTPLPAWLAFEQFASEEKD